MSEKVIQGKLKSLGIVLPPVPVPLANYVPFVIAGNLLFLSGQGPKAAQGGLYRLWRPRQRGADLAN